jgi:hypothetical protein
MKYSRDFSREKLGDPAFDQIIDDQVRQIAELGATHVAIATPYDEEFLPMLERWVSAARKYNVKVWFRGNWSGWEGWFDYPKISRGDHHEKTRQFIVRNAVLFEDGDVFTGCPECENGGPGDPRRTGDVAGHRAFLIEDTRLTQEAFRSINKTVQSNFHSMNADVARLVMDPETTKALGGIVVIDHYVPTPQQLALDVAAIARASGGKVVIGEFGAPIGDIHGTMTEEEQAAWINSALLALTRQDNLVGLSYRTQLLGERRWINTALDSGWYPQKRCRRIAIVLLAQAYAG